MLEEKLTLAISSCEKFSDLWENHIEILNESWPDREIDTFLITDRETNRRFDNIEVISAGEGKEYPQRMAEVIQHIKTEYVLITLDDYFPIKKIYN